MNERLNELVTFYLISSTFIYKITCFFLVFEGVNLIILVYSDLLVIPSWFNDRT